MIGWMIAGALLLAALALPCLLALRGGVEPQGRRVPALALHRARLASVERDRDIGLIAPEDADAARLEIQRQLLTEADRVEPAGAPVASGRGWLIGAAVAMPLASLALYLSVGHPLLPSAPMALREQARADDPQTARDAQLVATLRARLAGLDPASSQGREGYTLLGRVEATQGHWSEAARAWRKAVDARFDPALAVSAAEAQCRADGRVSADSAALFRRALAEGPADAPWRGLAQERLVEAEAAPH